MPLDGALLSQLPGWQRGEDGTSDGRKGTIAEVPVAPWGRDGKKNRGKELRRVFLVEEGGRSVFYLAYGKEKEKKDSAGCSGTMEEEGKEGRKGAIGVFCHLPVHRIVPRLLLEEAAHRSEAKTRGKKKESVKTLAPPLT